MSTHKLNLYGRLTVTILNACDLKDLNLVDRMDPYVDIKVGGSGEKYKTQVATNQGTSPVWNQSFIFNLQGKEDLIHFEVKTKNTLSDEIIGRLDIGLEKLNYRNEPTWHQIFDKHNFTKVNGQIQIQFKFEGDGLPASFTAPASQPLTPQNYQPQQQQYQQPPQPQVIYTQAPQPQVVYAQPPPQVVYAQPQPMYMPQPQPVFMQQPAVYQAVPMAQPVYSQQYPPQQPGWSQYPGQQ